MNKLVLLCCIIIITTSCKSESETKTSTNPILNDAIENLERNLLSKKSILMGKIKEYEPSIYAEDHLVCLNQFEFLEQRLLVYSLVEDLSCDSFTNQKNKIDSIFSSSIDYERFRKYFINYSFPFVTMEEIGCTSNSKEAAQLLKLYILNTRLRLVEDCYILCSTPCFGKGFGLLPYEIIELDSINGGQLILNANIPLFEINNFEIKAVKSKSGNNQSNNFSIEKMSDRMIYVTTKKSIPGDYVLVGELQVKNKKGDIEIFTIHKEFQIY